MAKAQAKTTENENSVPGFLKTLTDKQQQKDALTLMKIMEEESGFKAKMWGPAIVGYGSYHYKYESGHEGDAPLVAFSPRKNSLVLYFPSLFDKRAELLKEFGKHKAGKACIYVKKMEDIHVPVLKKMITNSLKYMKAKHK